MDAEAGCVGLCSSAMHDTPETRVPDVHLIWINNRLAAWA
jgi:hypothetical protein